MNTKLQKSFEVIFFPLVVSVKHYKNKEFPPNSRSF